MPSTKAAPPRHRASDAPKKLRSFLDVFGPAISQLFLAARVSGGHRSAGGKVVVMLSGALVTAALSGLAACERGSFATASPSHCTEVGSQCQLPNGPLGVCERSACGPGKTPPCFSCTPQH